MGSIPIVLETDKSLCDFMYWLHNRYWQLIAMIHYVSFVRDINSCLVALSLQITSAALHENDHQVTITLNYALAINKVSLGDEAHRQAAGVKLLLEQSG